MISRMTDIDETSESPADSLCIACGLCCTGHLFIWARLRPSELDRAEGWGMKVFRDDPSQRGFSLPCPLWKGQCTIHTSRHYPHVCREYKCKLLKEVIAERIPLPDALKIIEQAKEMIRELKALLPASPNNNFRERLVAHLESLEKSNTQKAADLEFRQKTDTLLIFYEEYLGVKDLVDKPDEE
jgi:uncharacterized protein